MRGHIQERLLALSKEQEEDRTKKQEQLNYLDEQIKQIEELKRKVREGGLVLRAEPRPATDPNTPRRQLRGRRRAQQALEPLPEHTDNIASGDDDNGDNMNEDINNCTSALDDVHLTE